MATEVVGEITALIAMAKPRPRLMVGRLPRSNGCDQFIRSSTLSITFSTGASLRTVPVACGRAFVDDVLAAELDRIDLQRARHHVHVAFVGPDELRHAEAAQRAGRRLTLV